ncbi:glycosyltransferase family 4 protein [Sphingomonas sp. SUN019]|uniref:glycosyltransferase family 4 protein n=1 Tax=Sphingomonas sp. SUN019 TaxID=2937788 RepID=UPI002164D738|nr:glycosyltransferase family 4 protein [Sphingomonas sp. SUN019]UVO49028.1 glycosyltransferase family 4 protein [Sphingomonas sp. SUN019]
MRPICVTGLRGFPGVMGGIESHCEELLPRIAALDPDQPIVALGRAPYLPARRQTYRGVEVVGLPGPRSKNFETILSTLLAIFDARRRGARVLHIHAIGPAILTPLARLVGLRVVVTHHGADYERAKWGRVATWALRLGERAALDWADRIVAISPSLADGLRARFPHKAEVIHYIPNGAPALPAVENDEDVLARLGIGDTPFLLAVGRLVPEKGLHDLIAAHRKSGTTRKLVIVGGADHASHYARDLIAAAGPDVIFAGVQSRDVLGALYRRCALFVMPSYHEGLPIAALEAASGGAAMVLSDIPANLDIGLPRANYVPVGDVDRLAAMLGSDEFTLRVDGAAVRARFSWDRAAVETLALYRALLPERSRRIPASAY